ncbi:ribosomal large subunit pseudouridine synthase F RluF [Psychroflexus torquis ATCC 700755]|uniref:Pseudouridine synthase n=1 Tax=Psychroflexus torquis (strain ATCC 700755 / CIP 106069 / ACAM 623) TaxID=313595 RepID=K4IGU8_PSYTT|nr:pseudouridine synthase [Psychroflexus torquis]AFU69757.1 ribosomal large subunit pseudouridine synthase F RluF [Psychroflexus torquis ATCC 700755]
MNKESIRINKYLSQAGFCSRREADKLMEQGRVTINGEYIEMGTKVNSGDKVYVDGKLVEKETEEKVYLAVYKPKGVVCTTNSKVEKNNIVDFVDYPTRIFPIGRLDKMSEGLILMTNDGEIVNHILRARHFHDKEYLVTVNKTITDDFIEKMRKGVPILDTMSRRCEVEKLGDRSFKIVLTQGLNRQIRRMCEALDYRVRTLKRTRIKNITLDVEKGNYRNLTEEEIKDLYTNKS